MPRLLALLLVALTLPAFLINLYFASLFWGWTGVKKRLGTFFTVCRAETSTCAVVVQTPYARLFLGLPNVVAGIPWAISLLALAVSWWVSGRLFVPWPYLVVAGATVLTAVYLIHALVFVLKQPCPLCMTNHALHTAITVLLVAVFFLEQ